MRDQLVQYVELLFAGAPDSTEIKQEILQNTLDRYDDLVDQGKSPEAAYRLAISGIGDIHEILGSQSQPSPQEFDSRPKLSAPEETDTPEKRRNRAVAIAFYILCIVPLIILSEFGLDTLGFCLTLMMVAAATALMVLNKNPEEAREERRREQEVYMDPKRKLKRSIGNVIWAIAIAVYFVLSFATNAWFITWILFPIAASVKGLVNAILDLKEACNHEN